MFHTGLKMGKNSAINQVKVRIQSYLKIIFQKTLILALEGGKVLQVIEKNSLDFNSLCVTKKHIFSFEMSLRFM